MGGFQLPARFGKYELQQFLGGGGMSLVYRAHDLVIGRTVVVKILTDEACQDESAKARFLAEARVAGNLSHDNILGIYDFGQDEHGRAYMVMEFLQGEDLRHAIDNAHTGDLKQKLRIALQAAQALEYIHARRIIHRDIKPENIHLNPAGVVKLMDFGIAKKENLAMTQPGYVVGTPSYMAPEQVTGQPLTEQVDVYAFGLVLFELLSGVKAITGETMQRLFYCILNEPLDLEPLRRIGLPPALVDLVVRCTAKDPAARPQGFAAVTLVLSQILASIEPPPAAAPAAGMDKRLLAALIAGGAVLLALVLYFAVIRGGGSFPKQIETPTGSMVLVASGDFEFGEKKEHFALPAFYVDLTEVTNGAYAKFCKETSRTLPDGFPSGKPEYPVVNVTILNARDYARWAGKRLPSAREWEKAARGEDGRKFPGGNQTDAARANVGSQRLLPAKSLPDGASPCGALQMAGNVWEFVEELNSPGRKAMDFFRTALRPPPSPDEPWYTIRGQSYRQVSVSENVTWDASTVPARWKAIDIGFRCVRDAR